MPHLLIHEPAAIHNDSAIRFGGKPVVPADQSFDWPTCTACQQAMQFQGQLALQGEVGLPDRLILLFMCQNEPGMCQEWEADAGGNRAVVVEARDLVVQEPLVTGPSMRQCLDGARLEFVTATGYDDARRKWQAEHPMAHRQILGQMFGEPSWLQADETPECSHCGQPMRFISQLETGPDSGTEMNFGGGCAYVFECHCGPHTAKLLWQC